MIVFENAVRCHAVLRRAEHLCVSVGIALPSPPQWVESTPDDTVAAYCDGHIYVRADAADDPQRLLRALLRAAMRASGVDETADDIEDFLICKLADVAESGKLRHDAKM